MIMSESKENKYRNRPSKQLSRKVRIKKSDWRYVPFTPQLMDVIHNHNPEDSIIDYIDGNNIHNHPDFHYFQVLEEYLTEKEALVVDGYLGRGLTFQQIGDEIGTSRQYANQIYKKALTKLAPHLEGYIQPRTQKEISHKRELNIHITKKEKI